MAEPNITAATAATLAGGAIAVVPITVAGPIFGLHPDALTFGFVSAMVTLLLIPPSPDIPRTPRRVFALVVGSTFLAGLFAPLLALAAADYLHWTVPLGQDRRRTMAAALIGISVAVEGLPMLLTYIRKRWLS